MPGYGIQFDDVPAYVDATYNDQQDQGGASYNAGGADTQVSIQCAGAIIVVAVIILWALAYWIKKG